MTEKLNVNHVYQTYGYRYKSNMYYVFERSSRCRCYKCKFKASCSYSYMGFYHNYEGDYIKCLRFVKSGDPIDKNVSLYSTHGGEHYLYNYFKEGRIYD